MQMSHKEVSRGKSAKPSVKIESFSKQQTIRDTAMNLLQDSAFLMELLSPDSMLTLQVQSMEDKSQHASSVAVEAPEEQLGS